MKKFKLFKWLLPILLQLSFVQTNAQLNTAEYFFDNDPGVGNGYPLASLNVTAGLQYDSTIFSGSINIPNNMPTGFHILYVRFADLGNGGEKKWSQCEARKIYVPVTNSTITKAEYFYDTDPGVGNGTMITMSGNTDSSSFIGSVNTAGLTPGTHNLYIRAKDEEGKWSNSETRKIYVLSTGISISKAEYFYDNDPGLGNGISISISGNADSSVFTGNLNTAGLSPGIHQVCIRTLSTTGQWSVYEVRRIEVLLGGNSISKAEYFVDTDPGVGQGTSINMTAINTHESEYGGGITFNPNLSAGYHSLYFRAIDNIGNWGLIDTALTFFNCKVPEIPTMSATAPSTCGIANITLAVTSGSLNSAGYWAWHQGSCNGPLIDTGNSILVAPFDTTTYFVRGEGGGCFSYGNCGTITVNANPSSTLQLTMFLQGYYESNGVMKAALYNEDVNSYSNITDSILVQLHDTMTNAVIAEKKVLLQTNGTAVSNFCPLQGRFNVSIKHRNTVETWSAGPVTLSNQLANYNFTTNSSKAYGNNMIEVEPNVWAFYSGDLNQDENVDLLDAALLETDINNFIFGYFPTDINGDGNVDLLDSPVLENNITGFIYSNHP